MGRWAAAAEIEGSEATGPGERTGRAAAAASTEAAVLRGAGRADPGDDMPAAAAAAGSAPDSTAAELEKRSRSRVARAAAVAAAALCQMLLLPLLDCACMMTDVPYARGCHSAVCPVGSWMRGLGRFGRRNKRHRPA